MRARTASDGQRTFALFDGDKGRHLVAYDLKTGKQLWNNPIEGHLRSQDPAPIIDSGRVSMSSIRAATSMPTTPPPVPPSTPSSTPLKIPNAPPV